jgi:4-hydroxy-3-methylbut-2-enyl diphosphate reductase
MGQLPDGAVILVETIDDVARLIVSDPDNLAYCTQTTLSVDDTAEIVNALKQKFPLIVGPQKEDICYATTNRQAAVKEIAPMVDFLLVIGSSNSSNSNRLVEVAKVYGCPDAYLINNFHEIPWDLMNDVKILGLTAGASAPDILIQGVIQALRGRYDVTVEEVAITKEDVVFNIPRILREAEEKRVPV